MAQIAKISEQVQLQSSGNKFYEFLSTKFDSLIRMSPEIFKSFEILEGNGIAHGSLFHVKYDIGGVLGESKERIYMNDAEKTLTLDIIEGDVLKDFEVFKVKIQAFDNGSNGSSVTWTIEFVNANQDVSPPYHYLTIANKMSKGLDYYLCNN